MDIYVVEAENGRPTGIYTEAENLTANEVKTENAYLKQRGYLIRKMTLRNLEAKMDYYGIDGASDEDIAMYTEVNELIYGKYDQ